MAEFSGMNIEAILGVADQLRTQATKINTTMRDVDRVIALAGQHWQGPNVPQFRTRWEGQYRRAGLATAEQLNNLADIARRNAETQRTTSNTLEGATDGGLNTGGGGGGGGQSWFQSGLDWLGDKVSDGIGWVGDQVDAGAQWVDHAVDTAIDWSGTAVGWVGDQATAGADWLTDRATDVGNFFTSIGGDIYGFVAPRVQAAIPALDRFVDGVGIAASQWTQLFTDGRVPQLTEVLASGAIVLGTGAGVIWNVASGKDNKLLDPGTPTAGQPVSAGSNAAPITDFAGLTQATMDVYGEDKGIRVTAVTGTDGVTRYIVNIPGTETEGGPGALASWLENTNGRNWSANLYAVAQGSAATDARAVVLAMQNAGIPAGAEVVLSGHSQGGIVAANLAADPSFGYDVKGVVTYGSPVQAADFPPGSDIPVLSINHGNEVGFLPVGPMGLPVPVVTQIGDLVPQLDLAGIPALPFLPIPMPYGPGGNITTIDLPPVGSSFFDMTANHEQVGYINSLNNATASQQQTIAGFENSAGLSDFYQGPGTTTTSVYVEYGGK